MFCPVPHCHTTFSSLNALASHLTSSVRGNRCGAYIGQLYFVCDKCGELCTTVNAIKVHASLHTLRVLNDDIPIETTNHGDALDSLIGDCNDPLDSEFEAPSEQSVLHSFIFEEEFVNSESSKDNIENDSVIDSIDLPLLCFEDDENISGDNASSSDETEDDIEESVPSYSVLYDQIKYDYDLVSDSNMQTLVEMFRYCIAARCTHKIYKHLRHLSLLTRCTYLPLNLKDLRRQVTAFLVREVKWPQVQTDVVRSECGRSFLTPSISIRDALRIWLSIPAVLKSVHEWNIKYLPENLLNLDQYEALHQRRRARIDSSSHEYETVADGSIYLENIQKAIPLFELNYRKALKDRIPVIVCNFGLYQDGFSKNLNSLVTQTVFTLTLIEATTGEASLTGIATLLVMLANSSGVKLAGDNAYWRILVEQLLPYEAGVRMTVNGEECLVIGFSLLLFGDTPAIKSMCGYSPSVSKACYVRMPCRICEVLMENLFVSIEDLSNCASIRDLSDILNFYKCNSYKTGAPKTAWLLELMKRFGFLRVSELIKLHNQPSPQRMGIDTMHSLFLGVLVRHFIILIKILLRSSGLSASSVWTLISNEFAKYCRLNKIAASRRFASKKEFKRRMTAGSMRVFTRVSRYIIRKIRLVSEEPSRKTAKDINTWTQRVKAYNYWCIQVKIASIVNQDTISQADLKTLDNLICQLMTYFSEEFDPSFVTINVHYYLHFVDHIRWLGPLKVFANNSREHLIQKIKPFYRNTNHISTEVSILNQYLMDLYFCVKSISAEENRWLYNREIFVEGDDLFDFSVYDEVSIDPGSSNVVMYSRESYDELSFTYNHDDRSKSKLNYCIVKVGEYIRILAGEFIKIGKFVAILTSSKGHFIGVIPQDENSTIDHQPVFFYDQILITSGETTSKKLLLVPSNHFIDRLTAFGISDNQIALVGN